MSTRSLTLDEAMPALVTQIRRHLIGQEAAISAFAAEICRHIALSPLQRRPGIFLVAGPNVDDDHLGLPLGLAATFSKTGGRYELGSGQGEDLAHIFAPRSSKAEVCPLLQSVRENPAALFVLQDIDKAQPGLLKTLMTAWSQGFIDDEGGEKIPLAEAIFVLTTEVAQEEIGQIARSEPDPDRLHVACLKLLVDAGFPGFAPQEHRYRVCPEGSHSGRGRSGALPQLCRAECAAHGLVLEEGGIDGRILAHSVDSSIEPDIKNTWLPRDKLDARLAQAKTAGTHTVRLVLGEGIINVVPVGEPSAQEATSPSADALPAASPDEEAKGE